MSLRAGLVAVGVLLAGCGARGELLGEHGQGGSGAGGSGGNGGTGPTTGNGGAAVTTGGPTTGVTTGGPTTGVTTGGPTTGVTTGGPTTGVTTGGSTTTTGSGPGSGTTTTGSGPGSSSVSTGTGPSTSVSSGSGGMICPGFGDPCTDCLSVTCADRFCNCSENPDCFQLFQCAGECGNNQSCVDQCYVEHAAGLSDAALLADCAGSACGSECPGNGGSVLEPCQECLYESCEDEMNSCVANGDCLDLYQCLDGCAQLDLSCQDACYDAHTAGIAPLQALLMCSQSDCPAVCN